MEPECQTNMFEDPEDIAPAFPTSGFVDGKPITICGLTKRELFAALAMVAIIEPSMTPEMVAEDAVYTADALLAELAKEEKA